MKNECDEQEELKEVYLTVAVKREGRRWQQQTAATDVGVVIRGNSGG